MNTIALGADHAGFEYKEVLGKLISDSDWGYSLADVGTYSSESVDYPDFAHQVAQKVSNGEAVFGVVICGSGNGVCMTANKHKGVRAALCWSSEIAALARQHNNANILCIPARFVTVDDAKKMLKIFINTAFEGGRHVKRADKIEI